MKNMDFHGIDQGFFGWDTLYKLKQKHPTASRDDRIKIDQTKIKPPKPKPKEKKEETKK